MQKIKNNVEKIAKEEEEKKLKSTRNTAANRAKALALRTSTFKSTKRTDLHQSGNKNFGSQISPDFYNPKYEFGKFQTQ